MALRVRVKSTGGTYADISDRVPSEGWEVKEAAEEGATPLVTLPLDDSAMDLDISGLRPIIIEETDSEADDLVLFGGFTADQEYGRKAGELYDPVGRNLALSVTDANAWWLRRVMKGSDCDRPAETDVERMQWLFTSGEVTGTLEDTTTYVHTSDPVDMDACDYRGQYVGNVVDDCAQQSGKNWWLKLIYVPAEADFQWTAWYGHGTSSLYVSPLSLSNDPADLDDDLLADGSSLIWPISDDTTLKRDPGRTYSGVHLNCDGFSIYRTNATTASTYATRDVVMSAPNVKTKTKANARATRLLSDLSTQDERITTTVRLPRAKATMIRAGMKIPFKATHLPGYENGTTMRVLTCAIKPVQGAMYFDLTLELQGPGTGPTSCSLALATAETASAHDEVDLSPSVAITPSSDAVLLAWLIGNNGNSPNATNMTAIAGGYTELLDEPDHSRSTYRIAAKAATGGVASTASATFTSGFGTNDIWLAVQVALLGVSSATPVQTKYSAPDYNATLDAPPTPGNIILVFAFADSGADAIGPNEDVTRGPTTGWVTLFEGAGVPVDNSNFVCAILGRCVQEGETGEYAFLPSGGGYATGSSIFIVELAP